MPAVHITGVSGSGKSTVASALLARGYSAVDADGDPRLAMWVDAQRNPVAVPVKSDGWMDRHWWVWNPRRMDGLIADAGPARLFVCGNAANENSLRDRFEKQILLVIDEQTMLSRLDDPSRDNDYGSSPAERAMLRNFRDDYQRRKLARGAIPIDATQPVDHIIDAIIDLFSNGV
jgi:adenylate kinase family enzyme